MSNINSVSSNNFVDLSFGLQNKTTQATDATKVTLSEDDLKRIKEFLEAHPEALEGAKKAHKHHGHHGGGHKHLDNDNDQNKNPFNQLSSVLGQSSSTNTNIVA